MNFFRFCLSGKVFISPPYLKDTFARLRFPGWQLFSFNPEEKPFYCTLAVRVSAEKTTGSLVRAPLWVTIFLTTAFRILFSGLNFDSFILMSWSRYLCLVLFFALITRWFIRFVYLKGLFPPQVMCMFSIVLISSFAVFPCGLFYISCPLSTSLILSSICSALMLVCSLAFFIHSLSSAAPESLFCSLPFLSLW